MPFDSVSRQYLRRVPQEYGFSESFIGMFIIICSRQEALVQIMVIYQSPWKREPQFDEHLQMRGYILIKFIWLLPVSRFEPIPA